jgi:hypothetical protein
LSTCQVAARKLCRSRPIVRSERLLAHRHAASTIRRDCPAIMRQRA